MSNVRRFAGIVLLGHAFAAVLAPGARAEVGVVVHPNGATSAYVEQSIVDDPDPISSAWIPHHPASSGRITLNAGGAANGDGDPSLITGPESGFAIAAWARNSPEGYDIVVSRFDSSAWTPPQVVADSAADELDPHLALDPNDGSIHLLYWINDAAPRIIHRQAPSDLSSWSAPVQVSEPDSDACRPWSVFHDGALHVVYEGHDLGYGTTPRQIVLAVRQGQAFSSQILTTTQYAGENWPRVHSANGMLWVDWIDLEWEMTWIRQLPTGSWEPVEGEYFQSPEEREFHVRGLIRTLASQ
jgi:hypothetical protein